MVLGVIGRQGTGGTPPQSGGWRELSGSDLAGPGKKHRDQAERALEADASVVSFTDELGPPRLAAGLTLDWRDGTWGNRQGSRARRSGPPPMPLSPAPAAPLPRAARLAPVLVLVAAILGIGIFVLKVTRFPFTGDEPGYVLQAESIWHDLDLDLSNNVGTGTRLRQVTPDTKPETVLRVGTSLYPVQPPGLPMLLTPAIALSRSGAMEVKLARLTMVAIAAAGFAILLRTLIALRPERAWLATAMLAAAVLSIAGAPWIVLIFPEIVAAACVAVGLHAVVTSHRGHLAAHAAAVALLPWLSLRFLLVAVLLVIPVARRGRVRLAVLVGSLLVSLAALALYSHSTYGLWNPASVYDAFTGGYRPTAVTRYRVGLGSLFSQSEGLFVVLPLSWLALFGVGRILRRHRTETLAGLLLTTLYLLVVLPNGARGTSPPPRLVVVLVPLALVAVWQGLGKGRAWLLCLAAAAAFGVVTSLPYLRGPDQNAPLFGDDKAIRLSGQVPLYPRMNAALGTEGPSRLAGHPLVGREGDAVATTWGPFQVIGGEWVVRSVGETELPPALLLASSPTRQGPYRPAAALPAAGRSMAFQVPGHERWLRAEAPGAANAETLDFEAVRTRSREGVVLSEAWKSAVLVGLCTVVVAAGYRSGARPSGPVGSAADYRTSAPS